MTDVQAPRWRRPLRIAIELGVMAAALVALDQWLTGGTAFAAIQPNPLWVPVLVMALAYGTGPGVIAAAFASTLWLMHARGMPGDRDYLDHLFHLSLPPLLWFVAAVAVGEVTNIRTARLGRVQLQGRTATRNIARMTEAFDTLSRTNRLLQVQIAVETRTLGHVVGTAARLSSIDPVERRDAITQLIAMAARTEDFTCYRVAGDEARAWLRSAKTTGRHDILPIALMERLIRRRGILHVARRSDRSALDSVGVAAVPLTDPADGTLLGCLVLHALPFAALNANRVAELGEIAAWLAPLLGEPARTVQRAVRPAGLVA